MSLEASAPLAPSRPGAAGGDRAAVGAGGEVARQGEHVENAGNLGTAIPKAVSGRYLPALDGLRAIAILGVIAYHLGYSWAAGGYLGVDLFFVLSGFLITALLVEQWRGEGRIRLGAFWGRRARRLLPGLLTMLVALCIWVVMTKRGSYTDLGQLRGDGLSTIFYFANWHLLFSHQGYFAQFASPSPLQHTWSLSIEEQFYLLWPLVLLAVVGRGVLRRRASRKPPLATRAETRETTGAGTAEKADTWRWRGLVVCVCGCLASSAVMAGLVRTGTGVNRLYYGTDTRAFDLLAGAALAMFVAARPQPGRRVASALHRLSPLALLVLALCWWRAGGVSGPPTWMFEGGFLLCAVAAATLLADVRQDDRGTVGNLLSLRPLRWIGKISYGLYLWHWPVIVELTQSRTGLSRWPLDAARVVVMFALSTISFYLVERPLRRLSYRGLSLPGRIGLVPIAMGLSVLIVLGATTPVAAGPGAPSFAVTSTTSVPGAGGLGTQRPIRLAFTPSAARPLHVLLLGDSVMNIQAPALEAAFAATGEAEVTDNSFPGWGLSTDKSWKHDVADAIAERQPRPDLVFATWSWDNSWALDHPSSFRATLEQFVRIVLSPGDGVQGLVFEEFPQIGPLWGQTSYTRADQEVRNAGENAWNRIASSMPALFPGRVMFLPVGASVLLDGRFSTWLPPPGEKSVPRSRWVRVRMVDNVHFCPAGDERYANAVLADARQLWHLRPADPRWSLGTWTSDPRFSKTNLSSSPCPDDHP